jgi:hypothetical protein
MKINNIDIVTKNFSKIPSNVESCHSARQKLEDHLGLGCNNDVAPIDLEYQGFPFDAQNKKNTDVATLKDLLNDKDIDHNKANMILKDLGELTIDSNFDSDKAVDITVKNLTNLKANSETGYRLAVDYLKSLSEKAKQVSYFSEDRELDLGKRPAEMIMLEEHVASRTRSKKRQLENNEAMRVDNTPNKTELLFKALNRHVQLSDNEIKKIVTSITESYDTDETQELVEGFIRKANSRIQKTQEFRNLIQHLREIYVMMDKEIYSELFDSLCVSIKDIEELKFMMENASPNNYANLTFASINFSILSISLIIVPCKSRQFGKIIVS